MHFKSDVGSSPLPFKCVVMWTPALGCISIKKGRNYLIKKLIFIFLIFSSLPLYSQPFTLIYEKELNSDFWNERNLKQSEVYIMDTPIIVNESEIAMIIRVSNSKAINKSNNLVQKEIPESKYVTEYNYKFEIFNISNNTFIQYDLPFLEGDIEIQEINYSQLKKELYVEFYEKTNLQKICYNLDSKELNSFDQIKSANFFFSVNQPLKINENQILAVLIDEESLDYAYNNRYEEYIGKIILYNSTNIKNEKQRKFEEEKIIQLFNDSEGNNILVSEYNNPIYNSEYNVLLVMTKHSLNEENESTLYIFKK